MTGSKGTLVALINHAFLNSIPIEVWHKGERIGSGLIELHTRDDVVIRGLHYLKRNCEFKIKS